MNDNQETKRQLKVILKQFVIDILIIEGVTFLLTMFWDELEILFDGGIQPSISDSVIAFILITIIWLKIRKWIYFK